MKVSVAVLMVGLAGLVLGSPAGPVGRKEKAAEFDEDPFGYFKDVVESFIEGILGKDNFQVSWAGAASRTSSYVCF